MARPDHKPKSKREIFIVKFAKDILDTVEDTAGGIHAGADEVFGMVKDDPKDKVDQAKTIIDNSAPALGDLISGVFGAMLSIPENIKNDVTSLLGGGREVVDHIVGEVQNTGDMVTNSLEKGVRSAKGNAEKLLSAFKP